MLKRVDGVGWRWLCPPVSGPVLLAVAISLQVALTASVPPRPSDRSPLLQYSFAPFRRSIDLLPSSFL
jgi:hypothetical protein